MERGKEYKELWIDGSERDTNFLVTIISVQSLWSVFLVTNCREGCNDMEVV